MLTPNMIDGLRAAATQLTADMEEFILRDVSRRIAKAGQMTETAAYQLYRLQALGTGEKEVKKYLQKVTKQKNREIAHLLQQAAEYGYDLRGVTLVPLAKNAYVQQIVRSAVKLAQDGFVNITQTIGMVGPDGVAYPLRAAYQKTMDYAFEQVITGAADYQSAVRSATRNLANLGIRVIDYESGVHTSIEAATRRNIMGGTGLMVEQINQYNHDQMGADGYEVSAHAGSAPDHAPIQGNQYTDAEYRELNAGLSRPIGTLNCGHVGYPIILGVSEPLYSHSQLRQLQEENERGVTYEGRHYTLYEARQKQRQVERHIRTQKHRCITCDATGDTDRLLTNQIKLGSLREAYAQFSKSVGLPTQNERAQVVGFGRSQASRAAWAYRKATK